jgi:hypothetical protein
LCCGTSPNNNIKTRKIPERVRNIFPKLNPAKAPNRQLRRVLQRTPDHFVIILEPVSRSFFQLIIKKKGKVGVRSVSYFRLLKMTAAATIAMITTTAAKAT